MYHFSVPTDGSGHFCGDGIVSKWSQVFTIHGDFNVSSDLLVLEALDVEEDGHTSVKTNIIWIVEMYLCL